jgi:hypothetical protein
MKLTGSQEGGAQMKDARSNDQDEGQRQGEHREQAAAARYQRAQESGSVEREQSALLSLEIQALQNRVDRLERRVISLEGEVKVLRGDGQEVLG